jgi:ferredoxin-NADP reductase
LNNANSYSKFLRDIIRAKIFNVINFVNTRSKIIFDDKYKSLAYNIDDKMYLRLYHEYFLFEKKNVKLFHQRFESYIIKRKIDNAAYELKLSSISRIYFVIFIASLEFVENELDFYERSRSTNSKSMKRNENTQNKRFFKVEKILKKRKRKYNKFTFI